MISCDPQYYQLPDGACEPCPSGADCSLAGSRLGSLLLNPGHWRLSNTSTVISVCATVDGRSPCVGGAVTGDDGDGYCASGHRGALCELYPWEWERRVIVDLPGEGQGQGDDREAGPRFAARMVHCDAIALSHDAGHRRFEDELAGVVGEALGDLLCPPDNPQFLMPALGLDEGH